MIIVLAHWQYFEKGKLTPATYIYSIYSENIDAERNNAPSFITGSGSGGGQRHGQLEGRRGLLLKGGGGCSDPVIFGTMRTCGRSEEGRGSGKDS